jgi:hypothetical protein
MWWNGLTWSSVLNALSFIPGCDMKLIAKSKKNFPSRSSGKPVSKYLRLINESSEQTARRLIQELLDSIPCVLPINRMILDVIGAGGQI